MKSLCCILIFGIWFVAPQRAQTQTAPEKPLSAEDKERQELSQSLAEAGNSPVDFLRALERHLEKYPNSKQRPQIERAAAKSAIEAKDTARTILYGERVLAAGTDDDLEILDRVIVALLDAESVENAKRALPLAQRYRSDFEARRSQPAGRYSAAQWAEQVDRGVARAFMFQAHAQGLMKATDDAVKSAAKSWDTYPTAAGARERGRWLAVLGKTPDAIDCYADAFTIEDAQSTEIDRGRDRIHLGELYSKINKSEKGLGDIVLAAYDRTSALMGERLARLKTKDPNASATNILDFALSGLDGNKLNLSSLKGKTVVIDFWATWCGPCRVQHPLIESVKDKFAGDNQIVFLSVSSDEDHAVVGPFLKAMKWANPVYFESGLSSLLKISSIPTVVVLDGKGNISSRMVGFIPERFTSMLTDRIEEARRNEVQTNSSQGKPPAE